MRIRFARCAAMLLVISAAAASRAAAQASTAADETQIRAIVGTTLADRINDSDAKGTAALWSATGTHAGLIAGARLRDGRASIEQMWASSFAQPSHDPLRKVSVSVNSIRFVRPDIAVVDAQNTYHGGVKADGSPKPDTGEILFVVLSRDNGAWLITASRVVPLIGPPPR